MTQSGVQADRTSPRRTAPPSFDWPEPSPTLVVYSSDLEAYDFGTDHPLQPERYGLTMMLIDSLGLLARPEISVVRPRSATLSELLTVHSYPYVQAVRRAQSIARGHESPVDLGIYGLGSADNPFFQAIHDAASLATGASALAVEAILAGEALHAYNPAGGLHHALRAHASGFCVYNDVAVAIHGALEAGLRVAYVDVDAHHGDGVQEIFYREPRVLTISLHESGHYLFPWTGDASERGEGAGEGAALNIPMPPGAGDPAYLAAMEQVVEPALVAYAPDILVTQTGCDAHWSDPLTHLATTLALYPVMMDRLHRLAHRLCRGRWLILGGGGYDSVSITPRAWTAMFATATAAPLPDRLPLSWLHHMEERGIPNPATRLLADPGPPFTPGGRHAVQPVLDQLRRTALPRLEDLGRQARA